MEIVMRLAVIPYGPAFLGLALAGALLVAPVQAQGVFSAESQNPGARIDIKDLKRDEGGTVTLRFQLSSEGQRTLGNCDLRDAPGGAACREVNGVHLIDAVNKKKYLVVRDANKACLCSGFEGLEKGQRANLWAKFPAPPEGVQKVTVIVPGFEPLEGVPIAAR
jgi:hypothetical protein